MAYLPSVRANLPSGFLRRFQVYDPLAVFSVHTGLGQAHARYIEQRMDKWESPPSKAVQNLSRHQVVKKLNRWKAELPALRSVQTMALLNMFHTALHRGSPQTKLMLVAMPLARPGFTDRAWQINEGFVRDAREKLGPRPRVRIVDATDIVDPGLYYVKTHLNPEGHQHLARFLAQPVLEMLEE